MAQVTVYTSDGRFSTTANDEKRPGEDRSELDRLLAGAIPGREGYAGGSVGVKPEVTQTSSSSETGRSYTTGLDLARSLYNFMPKEVLDVYAKAWVESGNENIAIGKTRESKAWEKEFGFLRRKDGTLVMDEITAMSTKASYKETLAEVGVTDFTDYEEDFNTMIGGGEAEDPVSAQEFQDRVDIVYAGVKNQIPEVEKLFRDRYGLDLDKGTIFSALVNPKIQDKILQGEIATLQLQAQASSRGFSTSFARFEQLRKLGLTTEMASGLYESASGIISQAAGIGRELDLQTLEGAALGQQEETKRLQRIQAELASTQGIQLGAAKKDKQITGLIAD